VTKEPPPFIDLAAPEAAPSRQEIAALLRRRDEHQGAPLRFIGWTLNDLSLKGLDFRDCEFLRCRAGHADFSASDLTEARFIACDCNNTRWQGATLSSASFVDCKLTGLDLAEARTLGLSFQRCLLIAAHLRGFSFRRAHLEGLDFQGADLSRVDFREAVLEGCSLRDANVTDARFEGADLRNSDLGALRLLDISKFKGAVISKSQAAQLLASLGLKVA